MICFTPCPRHIAGKTTKPHKTARRLLLAALIATLPLQMECLQPAIAARSLRTLLPRPARRILLGRSVQHREILALVFGKGSNVILVLGGVHGNEPSSVTLVGHLARWMTNSWTAPPNDKVIIVPEVNPDGVARNSRFNADGVDLNRNFPTADWGSPHHRKGDYPGQHPASEPETRALLRLISRERPCRIISVHAPYHQVNIDGPAFAIAKEMSHFNHYRVTRSIGYPTPGSLGTFAGKERHVPTITLEVGRTSSSAIWRTNKRALLAAIDTRCTTIPRQSKAW